MLEEQPTAPSAENTWFRDLGRAVGRRDWSMLAQMAGPPLLVAGGLYLAFQFLGYLDGLAARNEVTTDDLWLWTFGSILGLGALFLLLAAAWRIAVHAILFWPMTIILVLIGGFVGHGAGAVIGAVISGAIGWALIWLQERKA